MEIVKRPWGILKTFVRQKEFVVKEINVPPRKQCSLHLHQSHDEHWIIVAGEGVALVGDQVVPVSPNTYVYLPAKIPHRIINSGTAPLRYVEVVYGPGPPEEDLEKIDCTYDA